MADDGHERHGVGKCVAARVDVKRPWYPVSCLFLSGSSNASDP